MKRIFVSTILLTMVMILTGCDDAIVEEYLPVEELPIEETSMIENTPEDEIDEDEQMRTLARERAAREGVFVPLPNRRMIAPDGTEYVRLSMESPFVSTFFGSKTFVGRVADDELLPTRWSPWELGMYSLEGDYNLEILIRVHPRYDNWFFYRKASLPPLDLLVDNCIRFELVRRGAPRDIAHMSCGMGISDIHEAQAFLSDIRSQPTAREAGLHELVTRPDGRFENLVHYGTVFGFFEDVANLAVPLQIRSFNGEAFSIAYHYIDVHGTPAMNERVLPEKWLDILRESSCQPVIVEICPEEALAQEIYAYERMRAAAIERAAREGKIVRLDNGNMIAPDGTEYVSLSRSAFVTSFGSRTFVGGVADDGLLQNIWSPDWGMEFGMYSFEGDDNLEILARLHPRYFEWFYYRKASLPPFDVSLDNCIRFEFISIDVHRDFAYISMTAHMTCGMGITDPNKIQAFLADI